MYIVNELYVVEHTTADDKFCRHLFSSFSNDPAGGLIY